MGTTDGPLCHLLSTPRITLAERDDKQTSFTDSWVKPSQSRRALFFKWTGVAIFQLRDHVGVAGLAEVPPGFFRQEDLPSPKDPSDRNLDPLATKIRSGRIALLEELRLLRQT